MNLRGCAVGKMKSFNFGMVVGRFNHLHNGHIHMIEKGLETCKKLLIMVGSSQESFTVRNPFTCKTRMDIIRSVFKKEVEEGRLFVAHIDDMTNEDDHCVEWGDYVLDKIEMWRNHFDIEEELDCFVYGNDEERSSWYRPEAIEKVSQLILSRAGVPISATKMREFITLNDVTNWAQFMPLYEQEPRMSFDEANRLFTELREELLHIPYYKERVPVAKEN